MYFQITDIILWPRNRSKSLRRVRFEPGKLNIITGGSQAGKSAIVPIVDYCLGSGKCAIPVGTIRDETEWFGVRVKTSGGELLLGRREPGDLRASLFGHQRPTGTGSERIVFLRKGHCARSTNF
jgi:hypothetical protein